MSILLKEDFVKFQNEFYKADAADQWYMIIENKHLVYEISYDEDMVNAWLYGYTEAEYILSFKCGGGHRPVEHLLNYLDIRSRLI